ncbi:phage tail tape measure protein [Bacillus licheniformis]|uniref:phage tail tape measure protein n=1 Tax=Bacillus licheniformis TaxID=1402 RepID=UPI00119D4C0A
MVSSLLVKVTELNALKTIFARIGNNESSIKALDQIGISVKTTSGEAKSASELIEELSSKWDGLSEAQKRQTAIGVSGIYQLSRFNALMNQFQLAQDSATTAAESTGSAWKEQEKYSESLQARINRLSNAWTELSLASGDAVVSDGIVALTETLKDLVQIGTGITKTIGLLPQVFGIATTAVLLFNASLRTGAIANGNLFLRLLNNFPTSLTAFSSSMTGAAIRARFLNITLATLKTTARTTMAFLAGAVLPMAGFMALGFVIEKLVSSFSDAKQEQEKLAESQRKSVEAITTNKEQTDQLIQKFKELQKAKDNGSLSPDNEQEYLQVTQQLAQMFPNLISGYDSQGNAIIKNNEALEDAIKYTKELAELNKKDIQTGANSNFKETLSDISNLTDEMKEYQKVADHYKNNDRPFWDIFDSDSDYKNFGIKAEQQALQVNQKLSSSQAKLREQVLQTVDAYNSIKINPQLTKDINEAFNKIDFSKMTSDELESFSINVSKYMDDIQKALESGNKVDFSRASQALQNLINQQIKGSDEADKLSLSYDDLKNAIDSTKNAADSAKITWDENGEGVNELTGEVEDLSQKLKDAKGDLEAIKAVMDDLVASQQTELAISALQNEAYDSFADSISPLNELLEKMAEGKSISAAEAMKLVQKEKDLAGAITVENGVVKLNRDAIIKLRDAKLKAYNDMQKSVKQDLINQANATVKKIKNYGLEVKSIQTVADAQANLSKMRKQVDTLMESGNIQMAMPIIKEINELSDVTGQLEDLDKMAELANSSLNEVGTSLEKYSDEQEKASKETEKSKYVVDKYKEALEKVNAEIEKYNKQTNDYPKWSQKYRDAINKEIKALERKKKLMQDQIKLLKQQIKSGYIPQTGLVTSSTGSSSGSYSSGGSYSGKYSSYINAAASKYGVDPALIAAIIKQESNFNAKARSGAGAMGLMQLMPGTAKSLGVKNAYDPYQNIMGGTKYIAQMLNKFGGNIEKALAAYNAGPGNVIKYGGTPPFKETQNYVKKVLSNYNKSLSTATSKIANYYTSSNGFRVSSKFGAKESGLRSSPHKGTDFAAKAGTPVKALKSGKVITATYSKTAGNWVVIQQDDGTVAKYMHMQKGLKVKKGDVVSAGQTIGKVGSTGHSTGNHLHLQIEQNGKPIDPEKYMQGLTSDLSQSEAERQQALSQAKSDLIGLQGDLDAVNDQIQDLQYELVQSKLDEFDKRKSDLEVKIAKNESLSKRYLSDSKEFRKYTNEQKKAVDEQRKIQQQKINWINKELKTNKKLNYAQRDQLREELKQAKLDLISLQDQVRELQGELIQSQVDQTLNNIEKSVKKTESKLKDVDIKIQMTEDDNQKVKYYSQQIKLIQQQQAEAKKYIKQLEEQKKAAKGFPDIQKQITEEIENWKDKQKDYNLELYNTKKSIKDIYKSLADEVVSIYKEMYEKMRDIELEAHRKATQDIIDEIDKEDDEAKFQKSLKEKQDAIQETKDKISKLSLDDSDEAKAKLKDLDKQLQEQQQDLDEFLKDRENSKRKEALQDQLEKDEKSINTKYDDLVNDERAFKKLEDKLMNGKITDIAKQLNEFSKFINSNMESIGKSISNNLIDKLKEASKALNVVVAGNTTGKKVASFDVGGYTGTWGSSGRLAMLHEQELVLNKADTSNVLKIVELTRNIFGDIQTKATLPSPNAANQTTSNQTFNFNFNVDKMTGSKDDANKFLGEAFNIVSARGVKI